jgi:hypothetical protein
VQLTVRVKVIRRHADMAASRLTRTLLFACAAFWGDDLAILFPEYADVGIG